LALEVYNKLEQKQCIFTTSINISVGKRPIFFSRETKCEISSGHQYSSSIRTKSYDVKKTRMKQLQHTIHQRIKITNNKM
jgi:hypothetical protein